MINTLKIPYIPEQFGPFSDSTVSFFSPGDEEAAAAAMIPREGGGWLKKNKR